MAPMVKSKKTEILMEGPPSNGAMKLDFKVLLEKKKYHWGAKTQVYEFFKTQGKAGDIQF